MEPKWVIYVLAGTYWRIWGHPQHGIHCYRRALAGVPDQFKDVVLTNLAGENHQLTISLYVYCALYTTIAEV